MKIKAKRKKKKCPPSRFKSKTIHKKMPNKGDSPNQNIYLLICRMKFYVKAKLR